MSTFKGNDGIVKLGTSGGTNIVGEVKSYSLEHTSDTVEDTAMGDASRTHIATLKSFSGSLDVFWDDSDTNGQGAFVVGNTIELNLYPAGVSDTYYSGQAIVTGVSRTGSFDGMVEASLSVQGTGDLDTTTV
jgi:predicted secreted protein